MPRGTPGCWVCGEPVEMELQTWLRDYTDGRDACNNRRQVSRESLQRSMCEPHARERYDRFVRLFGDSRKGWGCCVCGDATSSRIQIWLRLRDGAKRKSVASLGRSFCPDCVDLWWCLIAHAMGGETWRPTGQRGGDMAHVRAAVGGVATALPSELS